MKKLIKLFTTLTLVFATFSSVYASETLYFNGNVFISKDSFAKWFVVKDNKITKIGTKEISNNEKSQYAKKINLNKKTVIPGFVDSHIHFIDGSLGLLTKNLSKVETLEELKKILKSNKKNLIDGILLASGLNSYLPNKIKNPRKWLDNITGDIPTFIFADGHKNLANSAGLILLGFNKNSSIKGGKFLKDSNGELNGVLLENAAFKANQKINEQLSMKTIQHAILVGQQKALSYGITTMGDNMFNPQYYKAYKHLSNRDLLKIRLFTRSYGSNKYSQAVVPGLNRKKLGFIGEKVDTEKLNYHSAKFFIGKSLTPSSEVINNKNLKYSPGGNEFQSTNEIKKNIFTYDIPLAFHIQGESGLQNILEATEETNSRTDNRRHVLDHIGYASNKQLKQIKKNNLAVTILPYSTFEYPALKDFYTKRKTENFSTNFLLNHKAKFDSCNAALTSDWPYAFEGSYKNSPHVDGLNPIPAIAISTTGKTPDGKTVIEKNKLLNVKEAILSYTKNGAYVLGKEKKLGQIAVGYKADFVILEDNIFQSKDVDLYNVRPKEVYVDGKKVFDKDKRQKKIDKSKLEDISKTDFAVSPVFGYNPSSGFLFGGAFFYWPLENKGTYFNTQLIAATNKTFKIITFYKNKNFIDGYSFGVKGFFRSFLDAYYGEGSKSKKADEMNLFHNIINAKMYIDYNIIKNTNLTFQTEFRNIMDKRVEDVDGNTLQTQISKDETNINLSFKINYDTRDFAPTPRSGGNIELSVDYIPVKLATFSQNDNLVQLNLDSTFFQKLYFPEIILALHLTAGTTINKNPSYAYRYQLGGDSYLRGYKTNRFRGAHYYHVNNEIRYPIYKIVSGIVFVDYGDVADESLTDFDSLKYSYGTGFRFKLSEMAKLRFDFGFNKEAFGMFFTFNEAF